MRVQVAQRAQEILGTSDLVIITERVDDVALLIGQMVNARKPRSCNSRLPAGKGYGIASAMGLSWVRPP